MHSDLSNGVTNIDSITKYDEYIQAAKKLGMTAMAFTEHGSVFSWVNKKSHIEAAGMKYIHGEEFYVTECLYEKERDNYHCCLYAKNYDGVLELNKLSSAAFDRTDGHYYYVPRISIDELIETSDNIIVSTACLGGILNKGTQSIKDRFITFLVGNKDRCFLEIQHHNVEDQKKYNQMLYKMSRSLGLRLIAGTDTHALNETHMKGRKILQKSKNVSFANEDDWDLTFKTYDELIAAYEKQNALPIEVVKEAIENTNVLASMVEEFTLDKSYKYPHLWTNPEQVFRDKIDKGIITRGVDKYPNYQEYLDRIEYELKAYRHNGAIDFMLLMEDIISWCNENDIKVGYGRGSCNGSVIAYLLGITEMDSIKHKLNFERFMNTERVSLSDIDTDFPPSRIDDVKQYIFSKTGLYCCDIITFNTIADKGSIKDIARAMGISPGESQKISNATENQADISSYKKKYPQLFEYMELVKGTIVSIGSHPCGCVVAEETLDDHMGLCTTGKSNYPISQIYMKEIDGLNYVKLDLLKLDTIEIINETCKLAEIERLTPDNVDINDIAVWNSMRDDTTQIFQWEGNMGNEYIKKLLSDENIKKFQTVNENVDRMTLLSIGNSAIRPAGASYRDDLANGVVRKSGSDVIDEFLKPTFGYLVFQCQIIDFLHQYCGFTMGEADIVRRCVDESTLITMWDGSKLAIKDILPGDYVRTLNASNQFEECKVNVVYDNGYSETLKIHTHYSYIIATSSHKFLTDDGWKMAKNLSIGDKIYTDQLWQINYDTREALLKKERIEKIESASVHHVYDLEIEKNHNYIANGIIVHNCFAKKVGTEAVIPTIRDGGYLTNTDGTLKTDHYIKGFVQTMAERYGMPKEQAEATIIDFLQVILDASNYLFSLNHSQPYSYEGYVSGWLRYYYPLEFLTVSLNTNQDKAAKTNDLIQYAKKIGIEIKPPKFRHSKAGYFCDKQHSYIYQGIASIKYMNSVVPTYLYGLKDNEYKSFASFLRDIKLKEIPINSRQLDILVKINFFEEFGSVAKLLHCIELFNALWGKKTLRFSKCEILGIPEEIIQKHALQKPVKVEAIDCWNYVLSMGYDENDAKMLLSDCIKSPKNPVYSTKKTIKKFGITPEDERKFATKIVGGEYINIDVCSLIDELLENCNDETSLAETVNYQLKYLGYIGYKNEDYDWHYIVVTNLSAKFSPRFDAYCINNGRTSTMKVFKQRYKRSKFETCFDETPFQNGDILKIKRCNQKPKKMKDGDQWITIPDVKEWWIEDYEIYQRKPDDIGDDEEDDAA